MSEENVPTPVRSRLSRLLAAVVVADLFCLIVLPSLLGEQRVDLATAERRHVRGHQWLAVFTRFRFTRFPESAVLLEDGRPLPHPTTEHDAIATRGGGRYTPWSGHTVVWSSSDSTDPTTNGRRYELVFEPDVLRSVPLQGLLFLTTGLVLAAASRRAIRLSAPSPRGARAGLAAAVLLAFAADLPSHWDEVFVACDTPGYVDRTPVRTVAYPFFIDLFDRAPERPAKELVAFPEFRARKEPGHRLVNVARAQKVLTALSVAFLAYALAGLVSAWTVGPLLWLAAIVDPLLGADADASVAFNMAAIMSEGLNQPFAYALLGTLALYLERPGWGRGVAVSLLVSVLLLVRPANVALISVFAWIALFHLGRRDGWRPALGRAVALGLVAAVPLAVEMAHNKVAHGRAKLHAFTGANVICLAIQSATVEDIEAFEDPRTREFLRVCLVDLASRRVQDVRAHKGENYLNINLWQLAVPAVERVHALPGEPWAQAWVVDDFFSRVGWALIGRHPRAYASLVVFHFERILDRWHAIALVVTVVAAMAYRRTRAPAFLFAVFIATLPLVAIAPACFLNYPLDRYRAPFWLVEVATLPFLVSALLARRDTLGPATEGACVAETSLKDVRQGEWAQQWTLLSTDEDQPRELFLEWIAPHKLDLFQGARVLDAGCGGGHHSSLVAGLAKEVVSVDLDMSDVCKARLARHPNVKPLDGDLVAIDPSVTGGDFDVVYSIGVLHHTYDPDRGFANLVRHVKPGGRIIAWVYSKEGNGVARYLVEPVRKLFLRFLPRRVLLALSWAITIPALVAIHTVYRLPLRFLPMYDYMNRSRTLTVRKVMGNVFDKLNAPHTDFISRERAERWLAHPDLVDGRVAPHLGVSWRVSATKRG